MSSTMARNLSVWLVCMAVGFLAIHGARMILYFGVFDTGVTSPQFSLLGLSGVYVVAWIPPLGVSFLIGTLLYSMFRTHAIRWALAYGIVMGIVWLLGTTHNFNTTDFEVVFGAYSWYVMPLLGAVLGAYVARRLASRFGNP